MKPEITIFIATDKATAKEVMKMMDKDTMPYASIHDDITYEEAVKRIDQWGKDKDMSTVEISIEAIKDLQSEIKSLNQERRDALLSLFNTRTINLALIVVVIAMFFIGN